MGVRAQVEVPAVVGVQSGMLKPLGANQAMKRRGGLQTAAPARRDHNADGKKGSATVTPPAPAKNSLRDFCRVVIADSPFEGLRSWRKPDRLRA